MLRYQSILVVCLSPSLLLLTITDYLVEVFLKVSACLEMRSLRNLFISSSILFISESNLICNKMFYIDLFFKCQIMFVYRSLILLNSESITEKSPIFIGTRLSFSISWPPQILRCYHSVLIWIYYREEFWGTVSA